MSREIIALFSSDARELYKGDIFRVLALPPKYVVHFRYDGKYIQQDLLVNMNSVIDAEGTIFFASGNDISKPPETRKIELYSIRNVTIKDFYIDESVKLFHFYLELGNFCDWSIHKDTANLLLPPTKFVSRISVEDGPNNTWIDRVKIVEDHFSDNPLFYMVNDISRKGMKLEPKYSKVDKAAFYELDDEAVYETKVNFYDPTEGKQGLVVENIGNQVNLAIPPNHRVGAVIDTEIFKLFTQSLSSKSLLGFSRLKGVRAETQVSSPSIHNLTVELRWNVVKSWKNIILFGVFSILAALGVIGIAATTKDFTTSALSIVNAVIGLASILIVGVAAALLYYFYNKK